MDVKIFRLLLRDERGQGLLEYALIIALISVLAFAALQFIGEGANNKLNNAALHMAL